MRKYYFVVALFLFPFHSFPQKQGQEFIDSLIAELPHAKNDTITTRLYKLIAEKLTPINPAEARIYADKGLAHTRKMNWGKGIAVFNSYIGALFANAGQYDSANIYYQQSLNLHKKNKDQFNTASVLINIGVSYLRQSKYSEAVDYFFQSLKISEELNDKTLLALGYDNISNVYSSQRNFSKALDYSFKALKIREEENNPDATANVLSSIANIYLELPDSLKAREYNKKALLLYQQTGNKMGIATIYSNLSIAFNSDYKNKIKLALKSQEIWDEIGPENIISIINIGNIGIAFLDIVRNDSLYHIQADENIPSTKLERLQKSEYYLKKAIALSEQTNDINNSAYFTGVLAEAQEQKGDFANAYKNFRKYQEVQDSVYSQENKNKIAAIESQREIDLKNKVIENAALQIDNQHKKMLLLLCGIAFLAIIGGLAYRQSLNRKKTNTTLLQLNNELDEANKVKAKFFAILSHDLRAPIANLLNFLQLQKKRPGLLSELQVADREKKIATSAESLLETMESMLLWSKGQMENFQPEIEPVQIADLFTYIQKFFADTENVQMNFDNVNSLSVNTDKYFVQTIMHNLTANAIKALQQTNAAKIEWKAWQENNQVYLSITDNGPGINNEKLAALYDETIVSGSKHGLGLHIIRDLAKAIGCNISLDQQQDKGTKFVLSI